MWGIQRGCKGGAIYTTSVSQGDTKGLKGCSENRGTVEQARAHRGLARMGQDTGWRRNVAPTWDGDTEQMQATCRPTVGGRGTQSGEIEDRAHRRNVEGAHRGAEEGTHSDCRGRAH